MKTVIFSLAMLGVAATAAQAQQAIVQFGPTTEFSTINCANFVKLPNKAWKATAPDKFGLGFVQNIVPPKALIASGGYIYNNIDLYSQLEAQCKTAPAVVRAKY